MYEGLLIRELRLPMFTETRQEYLEVLKSIHLLCCFPAFTLALLIFLFASYSAFC